MGEGDGTGEGFGRRWARLKRQRGTVARAPAEEPAPPEEVPPALDSLALEEIAPWLRRRVPELWKRAALRRIWLDDPAIRGFVGPADYAWDWNVPGGAPGYGPMRAMDDLARLLERAIGAPEPRDVEALDVVPELVAQAEPVEAPAACPEVEAAPPAAEVPQRPLRRRGGGAMPV